jgi:hypothetical protein
VLRNNAIVQLMRHLPTGTRDASHQESVWQSRVKLNETGKCGCKPARSVQYGREYLDLKTGVDVQYCNG